MVQGRQKIEEFWKGEVAMAASRNLALKTIEVNSSEDLAYEVGSYSVTLAMQTQSGSQTINDTGKYVTIWKRQADGSWKLAVDIWNSDLPAAPPQMSAATALQPAVVDVKDLAARSQEVEPGFYVAPVASVSTGEVAWGRFENIDIPMHYHGQSEIVYVLAGQVTMKLADGSTSTVGPGQLVISPPGAAAGLNGSGDFVFFATPPENDADTVWLEGPNAKPGAQAPSMEKPQIIDVAQRIAQGLEQKVEGFQYTVAYETKTGGVEFFRIDQGVALHKHPKENHILYILKGHGRGQIGDQTAEVGPGQIVVIPAGVPHKFERIGDEPLDFILFSTPPFNPDDIVWLK
jgi:quercetin dioxygenase-like cupin family protein